MKAEVTHTYTCPMHPNVVSNNPGTCPKCISKLVVDRRGSKQAATVYTCGMHPDVSSATAGKCPICGMEMVAKKNKKD
ncbi:MAG: heavy metal-binding domain-containing protein [Segetibacter sp.]